MDAERRRAELGTVRDHVSRNRTSAKKAGQKFERDTADYLATHVDDRIDIRPKNGNKDRGDIGGLRTPHGHRFVIEAKNERGVNLGVWYGEADIERGNDDALVCAVAHKRHGKGDPGDQWITMTARDLVALLTGERPT